MCRALRIILLFSFASTSVNLVGQNCTVNFPGTGSVNFSSACGGAVNNLTLGQNNYLDNDDTFIFDAPSIITIGGNFTARATGNATLIIPAGVTVNINSTNAQFSGQGAACNSGNTCSFTIIVNGSLNITNNLINNIDQIKWSGTGRVTIGNQFNNNGCMECDDICPAFESTGGCNENSVCPTNFCAEYFGNEDPLYSTGDNQEVCSTTATLSAAGGAGTWSTSSPGVIINDVNDPNTSVSNLNVGDNIFTWTVASTSDQVVVQRLAEPTVAAAGDDQVVCGSTAALSGNTPIVGTGLWTITSGAGGNLDAPASANSTFTGVDGNTYELTWTISTAGCPPSSDAVVVSFQDPPEPPTIDGNGTFCEGGSLTLTASEAPNSGNYQWYRDVVELTGFTSQSIEITETEGVGNYTVAVSDGNTPTCFSSQSATQLVTITSRPDPPNLIADDPIVCVGGSVELISDEAPAGSGYLWYRNGTQTGDNSQNLVLFSADASGTYEVEIVQESFPNCASERSNSIDVLIEPLPEQPEIDNLTGSLVCEGITVVLSVDPPQAGVEYLWLRNGANAGDLPTLSISSVGSATYNLIVLTEQGCASEPSEGAVVTIESQPDTPDILLTGSTICADGSAVTLTSTVEAPDPGNYIWYRNGTALTDETSIDLTLSNPDQSGSYSLQVVDGDGAQCASEISDAETVEIFPLPSAPELVGGDQNLCDETSTTIQAEIPVNGTGVWSLVSGSATIEDPNNNTTTLGGLVPGENVVLDWAVTNQCGGNSVQLTIENEQAPEIADAGDDIVLCGATTTVLDGSGAGGVWSVVSGAATIDNAENPNTSVSGLAAGVNVLSYSILGNICEGIDDQVTITVLEEPSAAEAGEDMVFCAGEVQAQLTAVPPVTGAGRWTIERGSGQIADPGSPSTQITGLQSGETLLQWTVSNGECPANEDQVLITVYPEPAVNETTIDICEGESVELEAAGGDRYRWSPSEGLSATDIPNPIVSPGESTVYEVQIFRDGCTQGQLEVSVDVRPSPVLTVSGDTSIFANQELQLRVSGAQRYLWSPAESLDNPTGDAPVARPSESTVYIVTGTNEFDCSATGQVSVLVNENFEIFVPDLFSPNGDGANDELFVNTLGIANIQFRIYDRRGKEIFSTSDSSVGWDGTFDGAEQPMDSYVYTVVGETVGGQRFSRKGSVQLVR